MAKLFMTLIGCTPAGRNIEQHDVYFGIGDSLKDIVPAVKKFWPDAGKLHFDAYREVTHVDGCKVQIVPHQGGTSPYKLFFINLGGYKQNEFEEFHYKMIIAAENKTEAINRSKQTAFFKHTGFKGASSHIDDKYGVDVDDVFEIKDILSEDLKQQFSIWVEKTNEQVPEDELHLGYFKLETILKS
ncbi:MAG TPA: DUF1543 domain-containing protein [Chitinophagaceae bacterium]